MRRPQFSLKTLLWLMAVVAAFLGGIEWDRRHANDERKWLRDANRRLEDYKHSQWETIGKMHVVLEKHGIDRSEISDIDESTLRRYYKPADDEE